MVSTQILNKPKSVKNRFADNWEYTVPNLETALIRQNLAFLEPMILGLLARGWITDQDKEFLDLLAPSHCISFLIYDGKYLNPEDLELFPHELIENTLAQNSSAVFSHIFRPEDNNISQNYKIETATVNNNSDKPIVFGFFGPEEILAKQNHCHDFHTIISRFRQAYQTAEKMKCRIEENITSKTNLVAVNRTSGRIIYITENMLSEINKKTRDIIGIEFNQFKKMLQSQVLTGKLKLQNLNIDDFMVSIIAISPASRSVQLRPKTKNFIKSELEKTIDKIKRRFEIYEHLFINLPKNDKRILRETSEKLLNNLTMQFRQLETITKPNTKPQKINLLYQFDQAVLECSKSLGVTIEPIIDHKVSNLYVEADSDLTKTLFESILIGHYYDYPISKSSLKFTNGKNIIFTLTSNINKTNSEIIKTDWMQLAENISMISGHDIKIETNSEQIITRLTFNNIER